MRLPPGAWRCSRRGGATGTNRRGRGAVAQHDMCTPAALTPLTTGKGTKGGLWSHRSADAIWTTFAILSRRISNILYNLIRRSHRPRAQAGSDYVAVTRETPHHIHRPSQAQTTVLQTTPHSHRPSQAQTTVLQTAVKVRASGSQGIAKVPKSTGMDPPILVRGSSPLPLVVNHCRHLRSGQAHCAAHIALPCDRARVVGHIEEERVTQLLDANQ